MHTRQTQTRHTQPPQVKICGVRQRDVVAHCVRRGVDAIGLNTWPGSPRYIAPDKVAELVAGFETAVQWVFVCVNLPAATRDAYLQAVPQAWLQLHGDETPHEVAAALPRAYKALPLGTENDFARCAAFPGQSLLVDARVAGARGGTGQRANWALAAKLAERRALTLAGGLRPDTVADAIAAVRPARVDTASGVEVAPGEQSLDRIDAFLDAVRS